MTIRGKTVLTFFFLFRRVQKLFLNFYYSENYLRNKTNTSRITTASHHLHLLYFIATYSPTKPFHRVVIITFIITKQWTARRIGS